MHAKTKIINTEVAGHEKAVNNFLEKKAGPRWSIISSTPIIETVEPKDKKSKPRQKLKMITVLAMAQP